MRIPAVLGALLGAAVLCGGSVAGGSAIERPNIVVLMTDDQTVESMRVMPNVRRLLAERGATFDNSFVSFSLCCPSRASLLTGQYAHNHGVLSNVPPQGGYRALDHGKTLAVWLRRAGYATVLVGKYLNGYGRTDPHEVPPGWTEWHASVDPSSYRYYGYILNHDGRLEHYGREPEDYKTDVYADLAVDAVRRRADAEAPFFLWVSFLAPHAGGPTGSDRVAGSALPASRHRGRFAREPLPRPASFNEADVSDKPGGVRVRPRLDRARVVSATERYRLRLESLLAVDEAVGRIVRELDMSGELDRTLILFTSDNGFLQGEHRIPIGKVAVYEPSTRVPLVVRGPGIASGLHLRQTVVNVDLAPTILEAAGVRPGLPQDGESLWSMLRDPGVFSGRDLLHEGGGAKASVLSFVALRTPRWIYARHFSGAEELYDLQEDPDELVNRVGDPTAQDVRRELRRRLTALAGCTGAGCRRKPELLPELRVDGECPDARVTVEIAGADAAAVSRVRFRLPGRILETDIEAPYDVVQPLGPSAATLRAHVVLADGREQTADLALPACS